jgi:hypothetical protein
LAIVFSSVLVRPCSAGSMMMDDPRSPMADGREFRACDPVSIRPLPVRPGAALRVVDDLAAGGALPGSHLLPSVRGELLARLGRTEEARAELTRAAGLCGNAREQELLERKRDALG